MPGREYDPTFSNRMLLQELKKSRGCTGLVCHASPHGEMAPPGDVIQECGTTGSGQQRCPAVAPLLFQRRLCGDLLSALEMKRSSSPSKGADVRSGYSGTCNQVLLSDLDAILTASGRSMCCCRTRDGGHQVPAHPDDQASRLHLEFSNHQANRALEVYAGGSGRSSFVRHRGLDKSPGSEVIRGLLYAFR